MPAAGLDPKIMPVFIGLMLGTLISSLNLTIVAPAMPTIVAELGGIDHYSWIALASMLASTIVVPIVGKLSDSFGRKPFYMGGILVFMTGSALAGLAPNFSFLIAARVVSGFGMGTMLPLSQAIIGDIISPRERGKYQGMMGAVFGLASIVGPVIGGFITNHLSWRWLFFVNLPVGLTALTVIQIFMHVPHVRRAHRIDLKGIMTLSATLLSLLVATEMGGTEYPWLSPEIIGMYALGGVGLLLLLGIERRAAEPVMPLHLWRSRVFAFSNIANMGVAMGMFGAIYFVPVFIQGVAGQSAAGAGRALVPLLLSMVVASILHGQLLSRTGRYKLSTLTGVGTMAVGFWLLSRMDVHTDNATIVRNLIVVGLGLGVGMQTFTLIVQNSVSRHDMGVATATTQLFRSIGAAAGVAVMGSLMSQGLAREIPLHVPAAVAALMNSGSTAFSAASVLDPTRLAHLPPGVLFGIRAGIADALHGVYAAGVPILAIAFLATLMIPELPLRQTAHAGATEAGKEVLVELGQAGPEDSEPILNDVERQTHEASEEI